MNDASSAYGASRRVLRNTLALVGSFYLIYPHFAWAASEIDNALRERFMRLSRFLVNHQLDALIDELLETADARVVGCRISSTG